MRHQPLSGVRIGLCVSIYVLPRNALNNIVAFREGRIGLLEM